MGLELAAAIVGLTLVGLWVDHQFGTGSKGLIIGAAATYLLTNENVQRAAIRGAVKAWTLVQGGVEELKERFQDAEAELRAAQMADLE